MGGTVQSDKNTSAEWYARHPVDDLSIADIINRRAVETPNAPFLIEPESGEMITYSQLKTACEGVARLVASHGVKQGEAVAFALTNGPIAAQTVLGLMAGGYVATAVNLVAGPATIAHVLSHSDARLVLHQAHIWDVIEDAIPDGIACIDVGQVAFTDTVSDEPVLNANATADGLLMYTSGTTGLPKGVVLTHTNLVAGGLNAARAHALESHDRGLCVLPLYHINGLCVTLLGALVSGGAVIMPPRFSVSRFWLHLRQAKGTWFSVVPTQISYLIHEADRAGHEGVGLEQVRFGRSASAPLSPDVQRAFEARFDVPIVETMGLTETAAQILSNPLHGPFKIGSPGIAMGNEVKIGNEAQEEVPRGEEGEVLVRGANVMRCYRNNEEATKASIMPDGWLRTGDLGRMDEAGYVTITGRLKELIIKGGENIAPREIDDALYTHPDVIEAAAFACDCPDYGQRVEAGVMIAEGSSLTSAILVALCTERLGRFKAPDQVHILPELPKGPSGKIQRLKLAEMVQADV